jgi:sulfatase modifying factor 1
VTPPENKPRQRGPHDKPAWVFFVILAVVLIGVSAGAWLLSKVENGFPKRKPVAVFAPPPTLESMSEMVHLPAGTFWMGSSNGPASERPLHEVTVSSFWIDRAEVSNEKFAKFVDATGYKTTAERGLVWREDSAGAGAGGAYVSAASRKDALAQTNFWIFTPGADWRHPQGPKSNIVGREKFPVVQITWEDAEAYARWAGKRLPTEEEWEYAARGGLDQQLFTWGNIQKPGGRWPANVWQGEFPSFNTGEDGYRGLAPCGSFPANGFGLFDVTGNAWEWCSETFRTDYVSPIVSGSETHLMGAVRGGSFLTGVEEGGLYRASARWSRHRLAAYEDQGFRCAKSE